MVDGTKLYRDIALMQYLACPSVSSHASQGKFLPFHKQFSPFCCLYIISKGSLLYFNSPPHFCSSETGYFHAKYTNISFFIPICCLFFRAFIGYADAETDIRSIWKTQCHMLQRSKAQQADTARNVLPAFPEPWREPVPKAGTALLLRYRSTPV